MTPTTTATKGRLIRHLPNDLLDRFRSLKATLPETTDHGKTTIENLMIIALELGVTHIEHSRQHSKGTTALLPSGGGESSTTMTVGNPGGPQAHPGPQPVYPLPPPLPQAPGTDGNNQPHAQQDREAEVVATTPHDEDLETWID